MRIFFAGTESRTYHDKIIECGGSAILQSAFYLNYKHQPNKTGLDFYLLDSGGFTAIKKGTPISVEKYADFVNKYEVKTIFNLDVTDTTETLLNQKYLERNTKAYVIPVYHHHEWKSARWRDLIVEYAKEYPFISIGGNPRKIMLPEKQQYMDFVYSKVGLGSKVHGLGVTHPILLHRYPWFSVDSTTWIAASQFGTTIELKKGTLKKIPGIMARGKLIDPKQLIGMDAKLNLAVKTFMRLEQHITEHWKQRGVVWDEKPFR